MKLKTMTKWPVLLAAGLMFVSLAFTKSGTMRVDDGRLITLPGRTAVPGEVIAVKLTGSQLATLKTSGKLRAVQVGQRQYMAVKNGLAATPAVAAGKLNSCPPITRETFAFYQRQANDCCCSFIVCLQDADCFFYLIYFAPNNGCTGGGNEM